MKEKKIKTIYVLRFVLRGVERTSRRGGGKNGEKHLQVYVYKRRGSGAAGRQRKFFLEQHQGRSRRG